jgi:hypothetical protein
VTITKIVIKDRGLSCQGHSLEPPDNEAEMLVIHFRNICNISEDMTICI